MKIQKERKEEDARSLIELGKKQARVGKGGELSKGKKGQ